MDLYAKVSYKLSRQLTNDYSTSFSLSSRLFHTNIRRHIYAIYGLVRVADEIVDTYQGKNAADLLAILEAETLQQMASSTPFSPNPIVHAFALTAQQYGITPALVTPFFESMRMDLTKKTFTQKEYETYIFGSAEVIGLMCLRVFTESDGKTYDNLEAGAKALGSAYQKVNFLRDIAADEVERGRCYFPGVTFATFDDAAKGTIESDIAADFQAAQQALRYLPRSARKAVSVSYDYYSQLFLIIQKKSAHDIKHVRYSVPPAKKMLLLLKRLIKG